MSRLLRPNRAACWAPVAGLLVLILLASTAMNSIQVNIGYLYFMRAVAALSARARFEVTQIGVTTSVQEMPLPPTSTAALQAADHWFSLAQMQVGARAAAVQGRLRVRALMGQGATPEWVAAAEAEELYWELALLALNDADWVAAADYFSLACLRATDCLEIAHSLVNAAQYRAAVALVRRQIDQAQATGQPIETTSQTALTYILLPGVSHAEIVANCTVYFLPGFSGSVAEPPVPPALADIHATCAEGLLVDPTLAGPHLGSALEHAQQAVDLGGTTRYRSFVLGWAYLAAGQPALARDHLRAALVAPAGGYQRGMASAELTDLIQQRLKEAMQANGE